MDYANREMMANVGKTQDSISVVIPTYNRASLIGRAVSSALAAGKISDEVIVIDDGSTDGTQAALEPFGDRIRYIKTRNQGAGAARNRGIQEAKNPLIAFLDSDDEWLPHHLFVHRAVQLANPDIVFSFSTFRLQDEEDHIYHDYLSHWHNDPRSWDEILGTGYSFSRFASLPEGSADFPVHVGNLYVSFFKAGYVPTFTSVVRKAELTGRISFPTDLPLYEDWEFFGRLSAIGPVAYLGCETCINHGHSLDRLTKRDLLDTASARIKVLERVWGINSSFLGEQKAEYHQLLDAQYLLMVKGMLKKGQVSEARAEIRRLKDVPIIYRILSVFPAWAIRLLIDLRARVKGLT